jgi:hypothetical protein
VRDFIRAEVRQGLDRVKQVLKRSAHSDSRWCVCRDLPAEPYIACAQARQKTGRA